MKSLTTFWTDMMQFLKTSRHAEGHPMVVFIHDYRHVEQTLGCLHKLVSETHDDDHMMFTDLIDSQLFVVELRHLLSALYHKKEDNPPQPMLMIERALESSNFDFVEGVE